MKYFRKTAALIVVAGAFAPQAVLATNGYFSLGYGLKAQGMGGAAVALTNDAKGGANNPASMVWAGDRIDVGFEEFNPTRSASRTGNANGLNASVASEQNSFIIPGVGYNHMRGTRAALGVTVYGNGGLNTNYSPGQLNCGAGPGTGNLLCGSSRLGVNLVQLVVAPTASFKIGRGASIGISPLLVHQAIRTGGLQAFTALSSSASNLSDNGQSTSNGAGFRLGLLGKLSDRVNVGAAFSPRIHMSPFAAYKGLFANQGSFDVPANYTVGVAINPSGRLTFAADFARINYADVASISNPSTNAAPLGATGGPGFGWRSISVERIGLEYHVLPTTTIRAGYNHGESPVQSRDVTLNILAPGIVSDHITLGLSEAVGRRAELTFAYTRGLPSSLSGATSRLLPGGGTDTINLAESSFGLAYGIRK
ncbi:MAG: TonB-dependent receptor [Candidatus Velthaea sp.]